MITIERGMLNKTILSCDSDRLENTVKRLSLNPVSVIEIT